MEDTSENMENKKLFKIKRPHREYQQTANPPYFSGGYKILWVKEDIYNTIATVKIYRNAKKTKYKAILNITLPNEDSYIGQGISMKFSKCQKCVALRKALKDAGWTLTTQDESDTMFLPDYLLCIKPSGVKQLIVKFEE